MGFYDLIMASSRNPETGEVEAQQIRKMRAQLLSNLQAEEEGVTREVQKDQLARLRLEFEIQEAGANLALAMQKQDAAERLAAMRSLRALVGRAGGGRGRPEDEKRAYAIYDRTVKGAEERVGQLKQDFGTAAGGWPTTTKVGTPEYSRTVAKARLHDTVMNAPDLTDPALLPYMRLLRADRDTAGSVPELADRLAEMDAAAAKMEQGSAGRAAGAAKVEALAAAMERDPMNPDLMAEARQTALDMMAWEDPLPPLVETVKSHLAESPTYAQLQTELAATKEPPTAREEMGKLVAKPTFQKWAADKGLKVGQAKMGVDAEGNPVLVQYVPGPDDQKAVEQAWREIAQGPRKGLFAKRGTGEYVKVTVNGRELWKTTDAEGNDQYLTNEQKAAVEAAEGPKPGPRKLAHTVVGDVGYVRDENTGETWQYDKDLTTLTPTQADLTAAEWTAAPEGDSIYADVEKASPTKKGREFEYRQPGQFDVFGQRARAVAGDPPGTVRVLTEGGERAFRQEGGALVAEYALGPDARVQKDDQGQPVEKGKAPPPGPVERLDSERTKGFLELFRGARSQKKALEYAKEPREETAVAKEPVDEEAVLFGEAPRKSLEDPKRDRMLRSLREMEAEQGKPVRGFFPEQRQKLNSARIDRLRQELGVLPPMAPVDRPESIPGPGKATLERGGVVKGRTSPGGAEGPSSKPDVEMPVPEDKAPADETPEERERRRKKKLEETMAAVGE